MLPDRDRARNGRSGLRSLDPGASHAGESTAAAADGPKPAAHRTGGLTRPDLFDIATLASYGPVPRKGRRVRSEGFRATSHVPIMLVD